LQKIFTKNIKVASKSSFFFKIAENLRN
jgi:hypothetical protein